MHLIVEADSARALGRGMQGFTIRVAKGLNGLVGRKGAVFTERYHSHVLKTPSEVRRARAYVIGNFKRHAKERGEKLPRHFVDAHSSWAWFDGWRDLPAYLERRAEKERAGPRVAAQAKGWLLTSGWRRRGLVALAATWHRRRPASTTSVLARARVGLASMPVGSCVSDRYGSGIGGVILEGCNDSAKAHEGKNEQLQKKTTFRRTTNTQPSKMIEVFA